MIFKKKNLLYILFIYASYNAIILGQSWDEQYYYSLAKNVFKYLTSFGKINENLIYREIYSPSLWTAEYLISLIFFPKYKVEIMHMINLVLSLTTIFGIKKICKIFFCDNVGKISFIILFLFPVYFGHMAINAKDTVLATCNVWTFYYLTKYLIYKKDNRPFKYLFYIASLTTVGTGMQLVYVGSLLPIIFFFLIEIFIFKKIIHNHIKIKNLLLDLIKIFLIFYILLSIFWIDVHNDIFTKQFSILIKIFSDQFWTGWPYNLSNGNYFDSSTPPANYYLVNLLYKMPEYLIFSYIIFFFLFFLKNSEIKNKYFQFNYKILILILIIIYPAILVPFVNFPVYDGLRLFLWSIPYLSIIPAILFDYILIFKFKYKVLLISILALFTYFIYNFLLIAPYHYTYLNSFIFNKNKKFENDYWGVSLNQLIKKINLDKNAKLNISVCGVNDYIVKNYLRENNFTNFIITTPKNSDYMIMTNRAIRPFNQITNCFDYFKGDDLFVVKKNIILSTFRKIK